MAVRRILRMGDPRLMLVSAAVRDFDTADLHALVADLRETMQAANGAGLAAPQIGVPLRVVIFGGQPSPRYPESMAIPPTVLVNPELAPVGMDMEEGWEGCLSVPGLRGLVPRYRELDYRGFDECGRGIERRVSGFHARVVQHEVDHLDGILYPRRIRDLSRFGFNEELFPGQAVVDE